MDTVGFVRASEGCSFNFAELVYQTLDVDGDAGGDRIGLPLRWKCTGMSRGTSLFGKPSFHPKAGAWTPPWWTQGLVLCGHSVFLLNVGVG